MVSALAILDPSPALRAPAEIAIRADEPPDAGEEFRDSYRRALLWVLGSFNTCPGSRMAWSAGSPDPRTVDVEHQLLAGRMYSEALSEMVSQQFNAGGEAALWWALGRP